MSESINEGPIILPTPERRGMLLEHEIKACWRESMLAAASEAASLSRMAVVTTAVAGDHYMRMKLYLGLAEGACRQMAHWREDARWLYLAPQMEKLRQFAQEMLQFTRAADRKELFGRLATKLRELVVLADALENQKTGKVGMILPEPGKLDRTEGRPVQVVNPVELAHQAVKETVQ